MKNARQTALNYLSYQDRSSQEVKNHLLGKGFSDENTADALEYLASIGLIDDETYCHRFIQSGIQKGRGPLRLEKELAEKGIPKDFIQTCLESDYDKEMERQTAFQLAEKMINQGQFQRTSEPYDGEDDGNRWKKEEGRIARRLASQGFRTSIVYEVIAKQSVDNHRGNL